jgi:uncharacterized repeat protein (TIGR03943 family)
MRRETQNLLLVLLGGALLKISFTGTYTSYVKAGHLWLLITAGVVMLALAAVSIARDVVTARRTGDVAPVDEHGHDHHHPARSAWLLLLPVLAVFLVAPGPLGSDAVERASAGNSDRAQDMSDDGSALFPVLPEGRVIPLTLGDFSSRASWDTDKSLDGRNVRLTGFIVHDGSDVYLARLAIRCCAADAYPVKVRLHGSDVATLADDSWVEVVVRLRPGSATKENGHIPAADVDSVRPVSQPADPYEH